MRGIESYYSPEGKLTFSVTKAKYSRVVVRALRLINNADERLVASSILRRNGISDDQDAHQEFVFTEDEGPLIVSGIRESVSRGIDTLVFQDQVPVLAWRAERLVEYISKTAGIAELAA